MLLLLFACRCGGSEPAKPPLVPGQLKPITGDLVHDPAAAYEACRERVEGVETEGECSVDADCAIAGCNGEVCTGLAAAAETFTTCEVRLCYHVLDSCGCHDGRCTWTLKPGATDPGP